MLKLLKEKPNKDKEILYLSVSKTKTFKDCKNKYKFQYIDKLPKLDKDYLIFGTFLHECLELFHQHYLKGSLLSTAKVMEISMREAHKSCKEKLTKVQFKEAYEILSVYLKQWSELVKNNEAPKIISTEQQFYLNIDDIVLLNGSIDLVKEDIDGVLHVADYKTTKVKSIKYLEKDNFQLKTYAFIMFLIRPDINVVRCSYVMLKDNMRPIEFLFTKEDAMVLEKEFLEYAALIKTEQAFNPNPTMLCEYCDFLENCPEGGNFLTKIGKSNPKTNKSGLVDWSNI